MKKSVSTTNAPKALGPYAQANIAGNLIFVSGQIPVNPQTGTLVKGGIDIQTKQVLNNIGEILKAADSDFEHIIKTTVYLKHMDDFVAMNKIYAEFFTEGNYPSRSAVQVSKLPQDALIEIEVIAEIKQGKFIKL